MVSVVVVAEEEFALLCGCSMEIFNNWSQSHPSVLPIYEKLISGGLRIWVYRYMFPSPFIPAFRDGC